MSDINIHAREAALSELDNFKPTPTSLIAYQSTGRVVVIGEAVSLSLCLHWSDEFEIKLIDTEKEIDVQGYLGAFTVTQTDSHGNSQSFEADILLDLCVVPINKMEVLPPGYLQVSINEENAFDVKEQVSELVGEFDKPKYFNYDPSICAHSVNGKTVCTNCIDTCPAGAIQSLEESIQVDPYLCQGGGGCATACPSGAIQYAYPQLADSGNQLRKMLEAFRQSNGENPVVVFHAEEDFPQNLLDDAGHMLPFRVEELASVGADLCLSALVYGASQTVMLHNEDIPEISLAQLNHQLKWMRVLLDGLSLEPQLISLQNISSGFAPQVSQLSIEPAIYSMPNGKRNAIFQSIDHLYQQIGNSQELVNLPVGAPFGAAIINEKQCTLCLACVGACPGKALQDGSNREVPEIFFIESNCIQCGACTQTCPEDAIEISPRMIFERERRNQSRSLNQDVPFACIDCGKPFAPTSVIHKMQEKLKGHYMFESDRALDRLKKCEDCRVADIVQDPEALNGNFDPLN